MAFNCEICVFTTHKKYNFEKHLRSQRHFINENRPKLAEISPVASVVQPVVEVVDPVVHVATLYQCKFCEQNYRHKSSLCKHIKHSCSKNYTKKKEDLTDLVRVLYNRLITQEHKLENQNNRLETQSKQIEELKRSK